MLLAAVDLPTSGVVWRMRIPLAAVATFALTAALAVVLVPAALAQSTGGAAAGPSGGATGATAYGTPAPPRPVAREFRVTPAVLPEGRLPALRLRVDHPGQRRVRARIVVWDPAARRAVARLDLGSVPTGRLVRLAWPRRRGPAPGEYVVRLHASDRGGRPLARSARATGKATLRVTPRPEPRPAPAPAPAPAGGDSGGDSGGGTFPVAGPHTIGGAGSGFGAGRPGHIHQGQDISAAEGVPVVTPLPGTVAFTDFQAGGAGEYVVVSHDDGRATFYAHCQRGSTVVRPGGRVAAGARLCNVGTTGASSGPHLHFELWIGGWRDRGGRPVDPLPFLRGLTR